MKNFAARTGGGVAISAALMSIVLALFVPYGYPWASLAWAVLACAAAIWVVQSSTLPTPLMSDVISGVESESVSGAGRDPGVGSPRGRS